MGKSKVLLVLSFDFMVAQMKSWGIPGGIIICPEGSMNACPRTNGNLSNSYFSSNWHIGRLTDWQIDIASSVEPHWATQQNV